MVGVGREAQLMAHVVATIDGALPSIDNAVQASEQLARIPRGDMAAIAKTGRGEGLVLYPARLAGDWQRTFASLLDSTAGAARRVQPGMVRVAHELGHSDDLTRELAIADDLLDAVDFRGTAALAERRAVYLPGTHQDLVAARDALWQAKTVAYRRLGVQYPADAVILPR